jgi:hypothetical protein
MIDALPGAVAGKATTVPSVRLRDLLEEGPVDLLKLDIEGAEDAVLADCEPVLDRVSAIVMDLHEFDSGDASGAARPGTPDARGVYLRRGRLRRPAVARAEVGRRFAFPDRALQWAMTVRAWRPVR